MDLSFILPILAAVIPVLCPIVIGFVSVGYKVVIAKLPANLQPVISNLANTAVLAAEQSLSGTSGATKFSAASSWLSESMQQYGINLSQGQIKSVIEEAVYNLHLNQGAAPVAAPQPTPSAA